MGKWVNEETPTMDFILYTINVEPMRDGKYVTWKYKEYEDIILFSRENTKLSKK